MSATVTARYGIARCLWAGYLRQLREAPLRTKMITSGSMFFLGDSIAQFGIEGRRIGVEEPQLPPGAPSWYEDEDTVLPYRPLRAARQAFYGTFIFAPLAHKWLGYVDTIKYASRVKTLAAKLALDQLMWGPFIVSVFWTSNGIMEGHSAGEVGDLVRFAFPSAYAKSLMVFAPTQLLNFSLVPLQHRLFVQQAVGLGWSCFLSYMTNKNNKMLAAAKADLARAQHHEDEVVAAHHLHHIHHAHDHMLDDDGSGGRGGGGGDEDLLVFEDDEDAMAAHHDVETAEQAVAAIEKRRHELLHAEGGGATGVGTRMGW